MRIEPEARLSRHLDYFGTEVIEFGIPTATNTLTIDVRARVVTSEPPEPPDGPWESAAQPRLPRGRRRVRAAVAGPADDRGPRGARRGARARDSPLETLEQLCELIPERFEYRPGVTYVGSTRRATCSRSGAGVCQDFVHLALILLRRHGIAARYVSGYLWAAPEDGGADSARGRHARLARGAAARDGGHGEPVWVGADPTNRRLAGETHVKIGHGRLYADVPPVKGVYRGGADAESDGGGDDVAPGPADERPRVDLSGRPDRPCRKAARSRLE